jgi:hypothetical protein
MEKISSDNIGFETEVTERNESATQEQATVRSITSEIGSKALNETLRGLETEASEPFGSEESYWTVYRMFASEVNRGRPWTISEIWEYLAKSYDMTGETYRTIEDTLFEWKADLEQDALERSGAKGIFVKHAGIFAYAVPPTPISSTVEQKPAPVPAIEEITVQESVEEEDPILRIRDAIKDILISSTDGVIKQAVLKKAISSRYDVPSVTPEYLQTLINSFVADKVFYKFRRQKVSHLSLIPRDDDTLDIEQKIFEKEESGEELVDIKLSVAVLQAFCRPGTHVQQKLTLNELWRIIKDIDDKSVAAPADEIEQLKVVCNNLKVSNMVTAGGMKRGTGGIRTKSATTIKRRRSATSHVYKVGLMDQDLKNELQEVTEALVA